MSFWNFRRSAAGVRVLLACGSERGLDAAALLEGSKLEPAGLTDPDAEVSVSQDLRVFDNLSRRLGHPPGLGLEVGLRFRLVDFGLWGYGLMSSPTLGAALDMAMRLLPLTGAYSVIGYHLQGDQAELAFTEPALPPRLRRLVVERELTGAAALLQQLAGPDFRLRHIGLKPMPGRPGARPSGIGTILGATPDFAASRYALTFDAGHLQRRLPQADAVTAEMCERLCRDLQERRRADLGTAALVQYQLAARPPGTQPSLGHVARALHLSERTLKRRLQEEGTTFRSLSAAAQASSAAELMRDPSLGIADVADRMGFADPSSFSQAFRRWYGMPPETYRRTPGRQRTRGID